MIPRRLTNTPRGTRRPNALDQEREHSEKTQEISYKKAINSEESATKSKHVRILIIATHKDKNSLTFWRLTSVYEPRTSDVFAWKFCHTLHVLLRDGHIGAVKEALTHTRTIDDVGQHFSTMQHGYGPLVALYCQLLLTKLQFHRRHPNFPGSLHVPPDQLAEVADADANNYFELAVEMIEYTECILKLYEAVRHSLDPGRSISSTQSGQCRLAPLIPCVQDSANLYDLTVRVLFSLHKALTVDLLSGHRERFTAQFPRLKAFYEEFSHRQFFQRLNITTPRLPQDPPNFLVEGGLAHHVPPAVVCHDDIGEEEPEEPRPPSPGTTQLLAQKDASIALLTAEGRSLRSSLQRLEHLTNREKEQAAALIADMQVMRQSLESALKQERLAKEVAVAEAAVAEELATQALGEGAAREAGQEAETARLAEEAAARRLAEDKFARMKEVYQKLRDEHVALIRSKAEVERSVETERSIREALESSMLEGEERWGAAEKERVVLLQQVSSLEGRLETHASDNDRQLEGRARLTQGRIRALVSSAALAGAALLQDATARAAALGHQDGTASHALILAFPPLVLASLAALPAAASAYVTETAADGAEGSGGDGDGVATTNGGGKYAVVISTTNGKDLDGNTSPAATLVTLCSRLSHHLSSFLLYAASASHSASDTEAASALLSALSELGGAGHAVLGRIGAGRPCDSDVAVCVELVNR